MTKQRILLLAESPYLGGISSHILSIADAFQGHDRFETLIATLPGRREDRTLIELAEMRGLEVHELSPRWPYGARYLFDLGRLVSDLKIDLVHTHNYRATLLASWARLDCALLNTCHGEIAEGGLKLRALQRLELWTMRRRPVIVACSRHVKNWLVENGVPGDRVRVVYNAVASPLRQSVSTAGAAGRFTAVYLGRLGRGKGVSLLIEALAGLPDVTGMIVGDGPLRTDLEALAHRLNVGVRFVGASADPWNVCASAHVVVLPSKMEALPMALIEAASRGIPCIATNVGGIPEVVISGETGILVPDRSVDSIRQAIETLTDDVRRAEMGIRARAVWQEKFAPECLRHALEAVYEDCLTSVRRNDVVQSGGTSRRPTNDKA